MGMIDKLQDVLAEKMLNKIIDTKRIEIGVEFKPKQPVVDPETLTGLAQFTATNDIKLSLDFVDKNNLD